MFLWLVHYLPSVLLAVSRKHLYGVCGPQTVSHLGSNGDSSSLSSWSTSGLTRIPLYTHKKTFFSFRFSRCEKKSEENLRISPTILFFVVVKFYLIRMNHWKFFLAFPRSRVF